MLVQPVAGKSTTGIPDVRLIEAAPCFYTFVVPLTRYSFPKQEGLKCIILTVTVALISDA